MRIVEDGQEYNSETAENLRPVSFGFTALGCEFRYTLQVPEYILTRMSTSDRDQLDAHMREYAAKVVDEAIRGGYLTSDSGMQAMKRNVGDQLKNYIWQKFSVSQERAGNQAWQTAPTLQEVHTR